jgi:hypothetical protein
MGFLYVKTSDGRKKPSVWVYIILLILALGGSLALILSRGESGLDQLNGRTKQQIADSGPAPFQKVETDKASDTRDAATQNKINEQIRKETNENGGYISNERVKEIERKWEDQYKVNESSNFKPTVNKRIESFENSENVDLKTKKEATTKKKADHYMTLAERLKEEGMKPEQGGKNQPIDFKGVAKIGTNSVSLEPDTSTNSTPGKPKDYYTNHDWTSASNILPLGTFIPCVLDGDVVTTDLQSHVWGNIVLDVTFRRQLQLPKGLVRIRGTTGRTPVQNVVDIFFDTMVFSDGTELPISAYAYGAFDPRYPGRFRTRGIPGEIIVPPMYVKLQSLLYSAALGASSAYIQNYVNQNTTTPSSFQTTPTIVPGIGGISAQNVIQQVQGQPVNNKIGATAALSAGQSALQDYVADLKKDLQKYQPYVVVEKGTGFYVQLDKTVDVSMRRVNGTELTKEEEAKKYNGGKPAAPKEEVFAPGDARAKYTGYSPSSDSDSAVNPAGGAGASKAAASAIGASYANQLNQIASGGSGAPPTMNQLQQQINTTSAINSGQPVPQQQNAAALQQLLQSIGTGN